MSDLTDALSYSLSRDLESHLDAYQVNLVNTGASLWPDATPQQAALWYLAHSLFKKYNDKDRPSATASDLALAKFLKCNEDNRCYSAVTNYDHEAELIQAVSDELYSFWYVGDGPGTPLISTLNQVYERGRLGKGSNRCARGTDFYTKLYDSPLSYTSESLLLSWEKLTSYDPRSLLAEQMRSLRYGARQVEGNALSFVNKNVTIARGICTEPTINMWFQLGTAAILTERLKSRYDVSLDIQPEINRAMARIGSTTGRFSDRYGISFGLDQSQHGSPGFPERDARLANVVSITEDTSPKRGRNRATQCEHYGERFYIPYDDCFILCCDCRCVQEVGDPGLIREFPAAQLLGIRR